MTVAVGQVIDGKYRIVKLLGQGGMGAVYLAEHLVIGRRVALKVLLGSVAENETAVARFEREAQAAARIGSDHILEIYDFGSLPDRSRYMVCEFLDGETLADRLQREGRLSPEALLPIACQLLRGLAAAHAAGVVHRDLKPENIFVLKQKAGIADFVKIIDFGISKFQQLSADGGMQMTATGVVVGTPYYLSPEQARGSREADARSDLYTVGVILYEALTGHLPFEAQNVNDLLFKIVLESPRPIRESVPQLDEGFARIVETAMARAPEDRFDSASAFLQALELWGSQRGVSLAAPAARITDAGAEVRSREVQPATRSLAPTPGTWADSNISVTAFRPPSKSRPLIAVAALVVVLAAGGAFAFFRSSASSASIDAVPSSSTSQASAAEPPRPSAEVEPPPIATSNPPPVPTPTLAEAPTAEPSSLPPVLPAPVAKPQTTAKNAAVRPSKPTPETSAPPTQKPSKPRRDFGY